MPKKLPKKWPKFLAKFYRGIPFKFFFTKKKMKLKKKKPNFPGFAKNGDTLLQGVFGPLWTQIYEETKGLIQRVFLNIVFFNSVLFPDF